MSSSEPGGSVEYRNVDTAIFYIRRAVLHLEDAALHLTESEDGRDGLNGPAKSLLGGIMDALGSFADLLSESVQTGRSHG